MKEEGKGREGGKKGRGREGRKEGRKGRGRGNVEVEGGEEGRGEGLTSESFCGWGGEEDDECGERRRGK